MEPRYSALLCCIYGKLREFDDYNIQTLMKRWIQEHKEVGQFHFLQVNDFQCLLKTVRWMDFSSKQPQALGDNHHICSGDSFYR